jgi:hypothetical protein
MGSGASVMVSDLANINGPVFVKLRVGPWKVSGITHKSENLNAELKFGV